MKRCAIFLILLFMAPPLFSLTVAEEELRKGAKEVDFINREGGGGNADPAREIISIGTQLAEKHRRTEDGGVAWFYKKYAVIKARTAGEKEKMDADIFLILPDARVTHITNVRRMIAGYLSRRYGYSWRRAWAVAVYVTYYNAVHRGDMEYVTAHYTKAVTDRVTAQNVGIDVRYDKWPGATRMIIPLTEKSGVESDELSSDETREMMRKDDSNLDERKEMTDMREEETKKERQELEEKKEELAKKEEQLEREERRDQQQREEMEREKREAAEKEKELEEKKEEASKIEDPKERKQAEEAIEEEKKQLDEKKEQLADKEEELDKKETERQEKRDDLQEDREQTAQDERELAKKEEQVEEEKKELAQDELKKETEENPEKARERLEEKEEELAKKEEELDKREDELKDQEADKEVYAQKFYYLKVKEYLQGGHYNNEMYMIDAATRKILFKSPVTNIAGRRYDVFSGGIVVITHQGNESGIHNLTLIDREKLTGKITGSDNIFWRSFIEIRGDHIYAVTVKDGKYYLGRYDSELKQVALSKEAIDENSFITFYEDYIYINSTTSQILVLNKEDLTLIEKVAP